MRILALLLVLVATATPATADDVATMRERFAQALYQYDKGEVKAGIAVGEKLYVALTRDKGPPSREALDVLIDLTDLYARGDDAKKAIEAGRRAVKALLASKLTDSWPFSRLATLLRRMQMPTDAEPLLRRALASARGPQANPYMVPTFLRELAEIHYQLGNMDEALALRKEQVKTIESDPSMKAGLPDALNSLGAVYLFRRDLHDAELTLRRSVQISVDAGRSVPGSYDAMTATTLLSHVVELRGARDEARALTEQAFLHAEETGGMAGYLPTLASTAAEIGDLDEAMALAARARQLGGANSALVLNAHLISASVSLRRGQREEAEVSLRAALKIAASAEVLQQLARLYLDLGEKARAESLALGAMQQITDAIKRRDQSALAVMRVAAQAAEANGRTAEAVRRYRECFEVSEAFLRSVRLGVQEDRLLAILGQLELEHDQIWSLVAAHPKDTAAVELGLATALLRKGRALDERAAASRAARASDPDFKKLVELRREYARLAAGGTPGKQSRAELETAMRAIERTLRATGREPDELPGPASIIASVRKRLASKEQLVEIIVYQPVAFSGGADIASPPPRYLAFVLGARRLEAIDLGPVSDIDDGVRKLREQISEGRGRSAEERELVDAQRALYDRTLGKLRLDRVASLILSLDGSLQLVSLEATRDAKGPLIDRFEMRYVTSGRDLLLRSGKHGTEVRVVADPAFSKETVRIADATIAPPEPLPYTRAEAEDIAKLVPAARLFMGDKATSDALLGGASPRILHVATHGVFLDDVDEPAAGTRGVELVSVDDPGGTAPPPNPMLRSALLLAKAPGVEDVVSAYRLADASLDGTQLVVLSACETGLGERKRNEGVFGLRRALIVAGAETVITSLWRVSDNATRDLMVAYYKKLLAGHGRAAALREAALAIRKDRPHPYYWAGFVAVGSGAPLGR